MRQPEDAAVYTDNRSGSENHLVGDSLAMPYPGDSGSGAGFFSTDDLGYLDEKQELYVVRWNSVSLKNRGFMVSDHQHRIIKQFRNIKFIESNKYMEQTFSEDDNIELKLSEIIARSSFTKVPADAINLTDMLHDVGIDSLSFMEIVVYIEEEFGITVADEDLVGERFDTVGALKSYIEEKRADTTADKQ